MDADEVGRRLGVTRAPGETPDEFGLRLSQFVSSWPRLGYGTRDWWEQRVLGARRWIRRVRLEVRAIDGEVRIRVWGPLRLPVPGRMKRRLERELREDAPINVRLEVR